MINSFVIVLVVIKLRAKIVYTIKGVLYFATGAGRKGIVGGKSGRSLDHIKVNIGRDLHLSLYSLIQYAIF